MNDQIFSCCKNPPQFLIIYSVAGESKKYHVCFNCSNLNYFKKFVVKKLKI